MKKYTLVACIILLTSFSCKKEKNCHKTRLVIEGNKTKLDKLIISYNGLGYEYNETYYVYEKLLDISLPHEFIYDVCSNEYDYWVQFTDADTSLTLSVKLFDRDTLIHEEELEYNGNTYSTFLDIITGDVQ